MARDRKHRLHLLLILEVCNLINVICAMAILCITAVCVETMNMEEYESVDLDSDTYADKPSPTTSKCGRKRGRVPTNVLGSVDEPSPTTSKGGRKRGRVPTDVLGSADEQSPTTSKGGRKRGRTSDGVAKSISEIATIFGSFCHATNDRLARLADIAKAINYEQDERDARKNLNDELKKLSLDRKTRMRALVSISKSDTLVDIFFSLKLEEERMTFIRHVLH